jgi:hypothetical protein
VPNLWIACALSRTSVRLACCGQQRTDPTSPGAFSAVPDFLNGAHISDAEVASWADEVRWQRSSTAPWHYVDIPVTADVFDRARDGKNGNNVIDANARLKVLADRSAPREKRQEARGSLRR